MTIKRSPEFEAAYARWRGETVGPCKGPAAPAPVDDFDRAFAEWEDVSFDRLVDQMARGADFDDEITGVYDHAPVVSDRACRSSP